MQTLTFALEKLRLHLKSQNCSEALNDMSY